MPDRDLAALRALLAKAETGSRQWFELCIGTNAEETQRILDTLPALLDAADRLAEVERERDDARRAIIEAIELPETAMTDPYLLLALEDQVRHLRVIAQSREARVAALVAALAHHATCKHCQCDHYPEAEDAALAAARGTAGGP